MICIFDAEKIIMKNSSKSIIVLSLGLSLLTSCGQNSSTKSSGPEAPLPQEEIRVTDGSNIEGIYLATFETLNPHVNGTLPGSATFFRQGDKLFSYVRLFAGGPRAWHQQKVYLGNRCPTMADDSNGDGYIDILEAEAVVGQIIIPLDADISSQQSGRNFYPLGDLSGSYFYERITSFNRFFSDLKSLDKDPNDNLAKLAPEEGFDFIGKVVMIQGTADTIEYPLSVQSTNRHRPHQTLPIACGIFKKVEDTPGSSDDGEIPGPIAEVEEGQDRPAEDDFEDPGTGATVGGGSNSTNSGDTSTSDENGNRTGTSHSSPSIPTPPTLPRTSRTSPEATPEVPEAPASTSTGEVSEESLDRPRHLWSDGVRIYGYDEIFR
jgi:hypothetical protein